MKTLQSLTCFCRLTFSVLAISASVWLHSEEVDNSPTADTEYALDGIGGFWMAASILFITSIFLEMMVLSADMPLKLGGYILHLLGALMLFITSMLYFTVPRRLRDYDEDSGLPTNPPPKNLVAGFTLATGLVTFLAQIILIIQLKHSMLTNSMPYLVATGFGVIASFLYFLGGIFWLEQIITKSLYDFEPNGDDFSSILQELMDHLERLNNRIASCLITGSVFFLLNAIFLGRAFYYREEQDKKESEEMHVTPTTRMPQGNEDIFVVDKVVDLA